MIYGIVGSEAAKFTPDTERLAKECIAGFLKPGDKVVSGRSPLGGIDLWSIEIAKAKGLECWEHPPRVKRWTGYLGPDGTWLDGYMDRNIKIATDCEKCVCLTVRELPPTFTGMRFKLCYHCKSTDHVKSGGCWTVHYARSLGKQGEIIVIG